MAKSSGLFLATIYNQSQLAERKHVARYWSINTAATAVPFSAHPSPLVITTKLAAAILGGPLFGGGVLPTQYCPCGLTYFTGFVGHVLPADCHCPWAACYFLSEELMQGDAIPRAKLGVPEWG